MMLPLGVGVVSYVKDINFQLVARSWPCNTHAWKYFLGNNYVGEIVAGNVSKQRSFFSSVVTLRREVAFQDVELHLARCHKNSFFLFALKKKTKIVQTRKVVLENVMYHNRLWALENRLSVYFSRSAVIELWTSMIFDLQLYRDLFSAILK